MTTVDPEEIARFTRMAEEWWDPHGKFKPLHAMNPLRIGYIRDTATRHFNRDAETGIRHPLSGLRLLDIGCGGGLIAEPMARLGAQVTAIDAGEKNIEIAKLHAAQSGLTMDYRCTTAEALAFPSAKHEAPSTYDIVLALEIVEHVADLDAFIQSALALTRPGGLLILSTLNRTAKSYALAILGAEYVLRWLPVGTHDWKKFLKPSELAAVVRRHGGEIRELTGMRMHPLTFKWELAPKDLSVNYLMVATR